MTSQQELEDNLKTSITDIISQAQDIELQPNLIASLIMIKITPHIQKISIIPHEIWWSDSEKRTV
jgi:hypothetical protein